MNSTSKAVVQVVFVSSWCEGDVRTSAKLNLRSGEIFDIEMSDAGADFEHLIDEYIESEDGLAHAAVVRHSFDGSYRVARMDALNGFDVSSRA